MSKKTYICPYCHVQVKHLKAHTDRMHQGKGLEQTLKAEPKAKGKTLELKTPPQKEKAELAQGYHCIDCGGAITKGQNPCPNCAAHLDWSQL